MRVGLIGASGFIGSSLCLSLSKVFDTIGFSSSTSSESPKIVLGDYASSSDLIAFCKNLDVMIYAAGLVDPRTPLNLDNIELKDRYLLEFELCVNSFYKEKPGGMFIFLSSAGALYPKSFDRDQSELSPINPESFYGDLKHSQEQSLLEKHGNKNIIILRLSNIFGSPFKKNKKTGLIDRLIASCIDKSVVNIFENLKSERDYLYIGDLVSAVTCILNNGQLKENFSVQVFNVSSEYQYNIEQLIIETQKIFGKPGPKVCFTQIDVPKNGLKVSSKKFRNLTGWKPRYSLEVAMKEILENVIHLRNSL